MDVSSPYRHDRALVIVNGLPASGKTTLARSLSAAMRFPLLSKDSVKETLFDMLGTGDREYSRRLGAASMEVLWSIAAVCPVTAVMDSWLPDSRRGLVEAGMDRAGFSSVVEVWCECPLTEVLRRLHARAGRRHPGHRDVEQEERIRAWARTARPLGLGPVLDVDTSIPVPLGPLVSRLAEAVR